MKAAIVILLAFSVLLYAVVVMVERPLVRHFPGVTMAI
jgi:hypothetical protein